MVAFFSIELCGTRERHLPRFYQTKCHMPKNIINLKVLSFWTVILIRQFLRAQKAQKFYEELHKMIFTKSTIAASSHDNFLSNDKNKCLISNLQEKLEASGFVVRHSIQDADAVIVKFQATTTL